PLPARCERGEGGGRGGVPSNCRALLKTPPTPSLSPLLRRGERDHGNLGVVSCARLAQQTGLTRPRLASTRPPHLYWRALANYESLTCSRGRHRRGWTNRLRPPVPDRFRRGVRAGPAGYPAPD